MSASQSRHSSIGNQASIEDLVNISALNSSSLLTTILPYDVDDVEHGERLRAVLYAIASQKEFGHCIFDITKVAMTDGETRGCLAVAIGCKQESIVVGATRQWKDLLNRYLPGSGVRFEDSIDQVVKNNPTELNHDVQASIAPVAKRIADKLHELDQQKTSADVDSALRRKEYMQRASLPKEPEQAGPAFKVERSDNGNLILKCNYQYIKDQGEALERFSDELLQAVTAGNGNIEIDFGETSSVGEVARGQLIGAYSKLKKSGRSITFTNVQHPLSAILNHTKLNTIFMPDSKTN